MPGLSVPGVVLSMILLARMGRETVLEQPQLQNSADVEDIASQVSAEKLGAEPEAPDVFTLPSENPVIPDC
jgi:hypothetical protein